MGKSYNIVLQSHLAFFGMQCNNLVLQLVRIQKKSSMQVTCIGHMYTWQWYKIEYCW